MTPETVRPSSFHTVSTHCGQPRQVALGPPGHPVRSSLYVAFQRPDGLGIASDDEPGQSQRKRHAAFVGMIMLHETTVH